MANETFDEVSAIIAYEQGDLDRDGVIDLFQHLVDNGHAWSLQGHYGRTAMGLINAGFVKRPNQTTFGTITGGKRNLPF